MAEEIKKDDLELEGEEGQETEDQANKGESGDDKGSDGDSKGADDKGKATGKTFTQEQLTRMMTKEKNQGRAAALKELGIDPKDEKMTAMIKAFIDSQKTDDQKAAEKQSEEAIKIQEAQQRALVAEAKAEAMQQGVQSQFVEDAVTLVLAKMTDDGDFKTLIGELKIKYPVWFEKGDAEDDKAGKGGKKTGQKGTGSSIKSAEQKGGKEEEGLGARLAAQRKASGAKQSYWGGKK